MAKEKKASLSFKKHPIFSVASILFLTLYSLLLVVPLIWCFYSSFKDVIDFQFNPLGLPQEWLWENYPNAFKLMSVRVGLKEVYLMGLIFNTLEYALLYSIIPLSGSVVVAYVCARYRSKWASVLYWAVIIIMIVPTIGGLASSLQVATWIGSYNNVVVAAIWNFKPGGVTFLVCYSTFKGIDRAYSEAAVIDGAGHFRVFLTVILPLAKNIIMAYFVTNFISYWNDWNTALVWFPSSPTLAYGLYTFANSTANGASTLPMKLTGCIIIMIPMLILFIFIKDHLIGKISFGGLKG